jgi:O-methyltransferase involved in polyketide biosynthesis
LDSLPPVMRVAMTQMTAQFAARGEPWKSLFEPEDLAKMLEAEGFNDSQTWTPEALNQRYLAQRTDGLHLGATPTRLVLARV